MHNVVFEKEIDRIEEVIKRYCEMKEKELWQKLKLNKKLLLYNSNGKRFVFENERPAQLLSKYFYSDYNTLEVTVNNFGIHITVSNGMSGYQFEILFSFIDINKIIKDMKGYFEWVKEVIDSVFDLLEEKLGSYFAYLGV